MRLQYLWKRSGAFRLASGSKISDAARMYRLAWIMGVIGLPLSHYWLAAKIEPFYSSIYCFLWWSYIFAADFAVFLLRGKSLLRDCPGEFLVLCIWSVPLWLLFEIVNLRIENWYYVMAPCHFAGGSHLYGSWVRLGAARNL